MSYRTIIELNHDYASDVGAAAELPTLLKRMMAAGYRSMEPRDLARLEALGITPLHMQHHTETTVLKISAGRAEREASR
jgi:hypothetical protein